MKFGSKKGSPNYGPGSTPVYLNVYDSTPMNGYTYWAGLGIFLSGVEGRGSQVFFLLKLRTHVKKYVFLLKLNTLKRKERIMLEFFKWSLNYLYSKKNQITQ